MLDKLLHLKVDVVAYTDCKLHRSLSEDICHRLDHVDDLHDCRKLIRGEIVCDDPLILEEWTVKRNAQVLQLVVGSRSLFRQQQ